MNKKKQQTGSDYKQLHTKIFLRTVGMLLASAAIIWVLAILVWLLYQYVFRGHVANVIVAFFEKFIYHDSTSALLAYQHLIRNNIEVFCVIAVVAVFLVILWVYVKSFAKYFNEINRGIDALLEEHSGEVALPPELSATEKKINTIKHTLEQRKLAAELAEQRKNDLVVYLAHDLKTPLTSVIGYLTLLRDENRISEELREKYLSISLEKAERLEDLINEFFEITRFNLSGITLEYSRVNLTRLLEQLTYEFQPMLREKSLTCTLDIAPNMMLRCDAGKLQRVFDNLLRNAVNYSFENDTIRITATQQENEICLCFMNHGNTIPKEKLERIFEQFYRLDTSRSSKTGGAGLGLAIAKEIVELHHGTIAAKSENEVIEFEVTLPVS